jgi:hypothetical protein
MPFLRLGDRPADLSPKVTKLAPPRRVGNALDLEVVDSARGGTGLARAW